MTSTVAPTQLELALINAHLRGNSKRRVKWEPRTEVGSLMKWGFYDHVKGHFHVVMVDYDRDRFHERVDAAMEVVNGRT